jgi:hypothetical protein
VDELADRVSLSHDGRCALQYYDRVFKSKSMGDAEIVIIVLGSNELQYVISWTERRLAVRTHTGFGRIGSIPQARATRLSRTSHHYVTCSAKRARRSALRRSPARRRYCKKPSSSRSTPCSKSTARGTLWDRAGRHVARSLTCAFVTIVQHEDGGLTRDSGAAPRRVLLPPGKCVVV